VKIVLVNEFSDVNCPVTKLVYDLGAELTLVADTQVVQANLRTTYRPGGTRWQRVLSLILCHLGIPVVVMYQVFLSAIKGQKICVVVTTLPPLLHWNLLVLASVLRFRCVVWYQDAHPEIEVRVLQRMGFYWLPRMLSGIDEVILKLAQRIVVLDEAMFDLITVDRKIPSERVKISAPWCTFVSPTKKLRQPRFSDSQPIRLIYAGNYGFAHDISPLAGALSTLSNELKSKILMTGIGMNAPSQERFKDLFAAAGITVNLLPRTESFKALLELFDDFDFGLVSLREDSVGLASPSKAYTYISQGLPILYVGPKRALPDGLVTMGFGILLDDFIQALAVGAFPSLKSSGSFMEDPKKASIEAIMRVIYE
jgi:hypothetical protein